ncbi:hypothetical protein SAMN05216474_2670 [Lishizhenia tianjinensis]|uniref:Tetratricopeptide repeat-containing protein n=1 Tax=Lishizhenia tianjinensis TaxID=477690 RepID=A0A1I7BC74_9FLAO|nr:hypothetical protein [Lishizhenia tianjinensis]SFT84796.1 hypothetical protein SAMN05216474_2670 [Lishizhenia tianjinensis]
MCKLISLLLFSILAAPLISNAQEFNGITYKQSCEFAYDAAFRNEDFKSALEILDTLAQNTSLKGEEFVLKAYCYKAVGDTNSAANMLSKAWSTPFFDFNIIFEAGIQELSLANITTGFSVEQMKRVKEGFVLYEKRKTKIGDSLTEVLVTMVKEDQQTRRIRKYNESYYGSDHDSTKAAEERVFYIDSLNQSKLKDIIKEYGFPGDWLCPGQSYLIGTLLMHATRKEFYLEMKEILIDEVRKGHLAPSNFAYWEDRYYIDVLNKMKYGVYPLPTNFSGVRLSKKDIIDNRMEIGLSKYFGNFNSEYQ